MFEKIILLSAIKNIFSQSEEFDDALYRVKGLET